MARNEDGEFELVLGNKQLVSVFLIVVILMGVFFSMGYIVGRNSGPLQTEVAKTTEPAKPIVVDHPSAPSQQPDAAAPAAKPSAVSPPPTETKPVETPPVASAPPPKLVEQAKPKPAEAVTHPSPTEPAPGDYWQVVATTRPDAELVAETLTKKGFKSVIAPAPKDGYFRVLVGPFRDSASLAQARAGLEAAGFKSPMVRKY